MKKDELIKLVGQLTEERSALESKNATDRNMYRSKDEDRRIEFTKMLDKESDERSRGNVYMGSLTTVDPFSWEVIFCKLGELKAGKNYDEVLKELEIIKGNLMNINNAKEERRNPCH